MPGPAPPVVDGLQIDQSLDFQRRFHRVQTVAWWVLALLPVAAVLGLFGGGLLGDVTARGDGSEVRYERFARQSVDTDLEVTVTRASRPVSVAISRGFLKSYDISEIRPRPAGVTAQADRLVYTFAARPGSSLVFTLQPQSIGSAGGRVSVSGSPAIRVHQFVYP